MKTVCNLILACALLLPQVALAAKVEQPGYPAPPPEGQIRTIQDTIYGVLRTHRRLRGMLENQQVLTHEVTRARTGFGPRVDLRGSAGGSQLSDSGTRASGLDTMWGYASASAKLVQPIWDGFATRSRVRSAKSTLESVQSRVFDTATSLSLDGIIAHIDLVRQREIYRLSELNVKEHKSILGKVQESASNHTISDVTETDVKQAQSRLKRAEASESQAKATLKIAEETYYRLTGIQPGNLQAVSWPPDIFTDTETVFALAEKNNPKLAAYMKDIRTARADRELAESAFYPVFNAEVGPSWTTRGGDDHNDRWVYSFDVLGTVSWNIFNSGADVAEWKAASARIRQSRQVMYDYIDDLKLDIDTTWANYKAAEEQYKHYKAAMDYNKHTVSAYWDDFTIKGRSLLDVLDSQNELYNNSTQAMTCWGNILVGAYRLSALTGNMLPSMSIDTGPLNDAPPVDAVDSREKFDLGWFN